MTYKIFKTIFVPVLICMGVGICCEGTKLESQDNEDKLYSLAKNYTRDFICSVLPSPHKAAVYGLEQILRGVKQHRKSKSFFENDEDFVSKSNEKYSVANLRVYNSSHVSLNLENIRTCVPSSSKGQDFVEFKIFRIKIGDLLSTSNLEVDWTVGKSRPILIEHDSSEMIILIEKSGWIRVVYDELLHQTILTQLQVNPAVLPKQAKVFLMEDQFNSIEKNRANYSRALDFTQYLHKEQESYVWSFVSVIFADIGLKFSKHPNYHLFQKYVASKTNPVLDVIGSKQQISKSARDLSNTDILRWFTLSWNCPMGGEACLREAREFSFRWKTERPFNPLGIFPSPVLAKYVEIGGKEAFTVAFKIYEEFSDPTMIYLLGNSRDPSVITDLISYNTKSDLEEPPFNHFKILKGISGNRVVRHRFLDLLSNDIDIIFKQNGTEGVAALVTHFARDATTQEEFEEVQTFMERHDEELEVESKTLRKALKEIKKNIEWVSRYAEEISIWLKKQ